MKACVLMPVRDAADSLPAVLEALRHLDPQPDRYIFCENNSIDQSLKIIAEFPLPRTIFRYWLRDDAPFSYGSERVAIARQFLLTAARSMNPDLAIFIDADIRCDSVDLLRKFMNHDKDALGGLYMRWMPPGLFPQPTQLPAYLPFDPTAVNLHYPLEKCVAVGAGCLALKRKVICDRRLNFDDAPRKLGAITIPEDLSYTMTAREMGHEVCVAKDVQLEHLKPYGARRPWD